MTQYYNTSTIWAAIKEHQHHPGNSDELFEHITKLYGIKADYNISTDSEGKMCYNLTGYTVVDERKHNMFLLKYQAHYKEWI